MITDNLERERATDPFSSFIVQAPAGSGKTELLTQRFLRLLGVVQDPEQIVALTFTRKAASEMRQRILEALTAAEKGTPFTQSHQQLTQNFAKLALQRDQQKKWGLLRDPNRLKIMTIDALCQSLVHKIPLKDKQTPFSNIADNPEILYRKAFGQFFQHVLNDKTLIEDLKHLLDHLDNRQDKFRTFMEHLLLSREQWLRPLFALHAQSKEDFERALETIEKHEIERFLKTLPLPLKEKLHALCKQVASIENDPKSLRFPLTTWEDFNRINKEKIVGLCTLLLTKNNELRKGFDHHVGFRKEHCPKALFATIKEEGKQLFQALEAYPDFISLLIRLKTLPDPQYHQNQWNILQALLNLMPYLLAHLQLIFNETNEVDFSQILQQALEALGDIEAPTDLALYFDYAIHHLLIDEFQDTSINQFQLLEKIIQGWQPHEGKTLFVVGDPMQSIYRFRQAEVGLFLKARLEGIGPLHLEPLELTANFRSTPTIVHWVNFQFQSIFPKEEDMETGAIAFHKAIPVLKDSHESQIEALQLNSKEEEASHVVLCIEKLLTQYPDDDLAVLVRSRSQLRLLIPHLRAKKIPFQGVEIELLSHLPHLQDIWTLTKALILPGNRLYWLAFLRSPWVGLPLTDLLKLANWNKKASILEALAHLDEVSNLSSEGYQRLNFIHASLSLALEKRHQQPFIEWLIETCSKLFSDSILNFEEQRDVEEFWALLEKYLPNEGLPDIPAFEKAFARLYSNNSSASRLQIMTIHKSKGLEFDTVILPSLGSQSKATDQPLIRWLKLPIKNQNPLFLVSPIKASHTLSCPVYDYLTDLDAEKEHFEQQRLLYVAATRAKKRLFLFDHQDNSDKKSFRGLLKHQIFQTVTPTENNPIEKERQNLVLKRLPLSYYQNPISPPKESLNPQEIIGLSNMDRQIGILTHELLQWICTHHPQNINPLPWGYIENKLRQQGISVAQTKTILSQIRNQLHCFLTNETGAWICQEHDKEENEYALLVVEGEDIKTRIIDRTFLADGKRWIIDFKTGQESFLSLKKHQAQVNGYANIFKKIDASPIHCGLYYLSTGSWIDWVYEELTAPKDPIKIQP